VFSVCNALVGDSPGPSIALLNSNLSEKYVFYYTQEMSENAQKMEVYLSENYSTHEIEFTSLPSISSPKEVILEIHNAMSDLSEEKNAALFITSGAKQVILPFFIGNPNFTILSLREGRGANSPSSLIQFINESGSLITQPTKIPIEDVIGIRGWKFLRESKSAGLVHDEFTVNTIYASVSKHSGRLIFHADIGKNNDEVANKAIAELILLSQFFGRNGAGYLLKGKMSMRIRNVLPSFIRTEDPFFEEEE
jgi:hypothetical protein